MANETIVKRSSYGEMIASEAVATTVYSAGACTPIQSISAITTTEKDYPTLDFKLLISAETITNNEVVNLYRIASDGTNTESSASTTFNGHYVGSFVLEAASTVAYLYGVTNVDPNDKFIWENKSAASITASLQVRTRGIGPAA
jgi:hypothetical protein